MQKMIKVHMKNGHVNEIPESNLSNYRRVLGDRISYVEEDEGKPIISKPVIGSVKKEVVKSVVVESSLSELTKKELQTKVKELGLEVSPRDSKSDLIDKINSK